jgi:ParB family chromosome partitioning protein
MSDKEDEDNNDSPDPRKRGLGRGLDALFEDEEAATPAAGAHEAAAEQEEADGRLRRRVIGIEQIIPAANQPRRNFNEDSIRHLADSIATHGVLQPLLVRAKPDEDDKYEIIAGERRWRAAQLAQVHEIPAIVHDLDDQSALEIALIENLQREDLNPLDEAAGYQRLMEQFGHTQDKLAASLGRSRSHIANMLRLLNLPEGVQAYVRDGKLTIGHARALLTAGQPEELAKKIVNQELSVRQTEKMAGESGDKSGKATRKSQSGAGTSGKVTAKDADTLALEQEMGDLLGMTTSIDMKDGQQGRLTIHYKTLDQLDEILHRLSHNPGRSALEG